ncbi:chemotaxis protein CheB [Desulfovibrio inopinatus]|uniref:chemotaxis protein CheB n=1 Tax=Desulfovibrio inopinatus TaxID=102109 RepID=UPI0004830AD3|nr:chemotaxis protein CheB [Desulfovibrio inopinatus]
MQIFLSKEYNAVVIGVSSGGLLALETILPQLPADYAAAVLVVQHLSPDADDFFVKHLNKKTHLVVKEAEDKEKALPGIVYMAPPNYHLMVEADRTLTLSADERVNFSRPSIDVLFETAAEAYQEKVIGVILTGANNDGAAGLKKIKELGGLTVVQSPDSAEADTMPKAALDAVDADFVVPLTRMGRFLATLVGGDEA